jgi:hypothetical protein
MAQTGFTPIITYHSTTPAAVPTAGNLAPGELGLNIADMKLYCENSSGVVTLLASSANVGTVTSVATGSGLTGGPITSTGTVSVATNGITNALFRQSAGLSLVGRSANSTGNVDDIAAGTDNQVLRRSGTSIGFGAINLASSDAVTGDLAFANITQIAGLSVLGVTGNSTADMAGITASTDNQVLRRSGTSLGFGAINLASTDAVTGDLAFSNLAQGSALSVLGVTGNSTADVASIAAASDHQVLRRSGTTVAFGAIDLAQANAITGTLPVANGGTGVTSSTGTVAVVLSTTPTIIGLREKSTAVAASDIDLSAGNYFTKTISGATTFTVSNVATSGDVAAFVLVLTNGGSAAVTYFSGVTFAGGTAPTLTASGVDILAFFTINGGTTWRGLVLAYDIKAP